MEIVLCVFLGIWISTAGVLSYIWLKREFKPYIDPQHDKGDTNNE